MGHARAAYISRRNPPALTTLGHRARALQMIIKQRPFLLDASDRFQTEHNTGHPDLPSSCPHLRLHRICRPRVSRTLQRSSSSSGVEHRAVSVSLCNCRRQIDDLNSLANTAMECPDYSICEGGGPNQKSLCKTLVRATNRILCRDLDGTLLLIDQW